MIVGNGLIAKVLLIILKMIKSLFFCVWSFRNSLEQRKQEFDREENILSNVINESIQKKNSLFQYLFYYSMILEKKSMLFIKEKDEKIC